MKPLTRRALLTLLGLPALGCIHRPPVLEPCAWGTPTWHPTPVLEPTEDWEGARTHTPCAMPFSDGCWWDEDRQRFCLWYMAGYTGGTALAQSSDGYHWRKLGIVDPMPRDSSTVWQLDDGTYARATFFLSAYTDPALTLQRSPDGITWRTVGRTPALGDRSTVYRLTDGRWVCSARDGKTAARARTFYVADAFEGPYLATDIWLEGQADDDPLALSTPQVYNLDARAFGAGYLGLMSVWGGDRGDRPKRNTLRALTSRDGVGWTRGPARWIDEAPGTWRDGNIQSCGGLFVMLDKDTLGIYVSARSGPVAPVNRQRCVTGLLTIKREAVCVL